MFTGLRWHIVIGKRTAVLIIAEQVPVRVPVQFPDECVEPGDRHERDAFMDQDRLFDEGDDDRNRLPARDIFIKCGSFLMLPDSPFQCRQPVAAASPFLAFHQERPAVFPGNNIVLPAFFVVGFYGIDPDAEIIFLEDEPRQLFKMLPDYCFCYGFQVFCAGDIFEVHGVLYER